MTRFLERALEDLQDPVNQEIERLFAYHQATKHSYSSVRATAHFLDWRNQPDPFRIYDGARLIPLERRPDFPNAGTFQTMAAFVEGSKGSREKNSTEEPAVMLDASWVSRLLWHSMAVSAWKQVPQTHIRYSLRVNPSSGNLHPTETHVALRGFAGLDDGLYHYRVDAHALEQRGRGDWVGELLHRLGRDTTPAFQDTPLLIALTSVFWREAWKYRDRAYRYCCHDLGHALMSLLLAARALGLAGGVVAHFSDLSLARTLGLVHTDEAPLAFLIFETASVEADLRRHSSGLNPLLHAAEPRRTQPAELLPCTPNELSDEEVPYYLLLGMHRSTVLPEPAGAVPEKGEEAKETEEAKAARDAPLGVVVRRRRSALDFDPHTPLMERPAAEQLLDFATRDWPADWRGNFSPAAEAASQRGRDFVELYIYAHRISGLEPGVYRWDKRQRRLAPLRRGNVERVAAYLSLEQLLAGHSCFTISMMADLESAARLYGNRGYRYVHFEAGAIGQRLYLGAEALGWNATGIGAFYDDDVHRYLGFLGEEETSLVESASAAEQALLVPLESEASAPPGLATGITLSESHEEWRAVAAQSPSAGPRDTVGPGRQPPGAAHLPRQVIYHFAVGRAVSDPRLAAPEE